MKKQLIALAAATSVSVAAFADISITGNAKYEYFNKQTGSAAATNTSNTEVNLGFKGKTGDTAVVLNMEFNTHGDVSVTDTDTDTNNVVQVIASDDGTLVGSVNVTAGGANAIANGSRGHLDIEDMYMTTKIGDISVKAGNWVSGTSSLAGEIKDDSRSTNKIDLRTTMGGATVYMGNGAVAGAGETALDQNMYYGVVFNVAGNKVELKHNGRSKTTNEDITSVGLNGAIAGVNYRLEQYQDVAANGDTTFGNITTDMGGFSLGYAFIDADKKGQITQGDSDIFAVEGANSTTNVALAEATGVKQVTIGTTVDGNKVTLKSGTVDNGLAANTDLDFMQIAVTRSLASGAKAAVIYTDKDAANSQSTESLEVELSVSF
jgi:hypothetical protein